MECPTCGSRFLRPSRARDFGERWRSWFFVQPVRCKDCNTRFITDTLGLAYLRFSKCPKCERMDLNKWTGETFEPKGIMKLKVVFGANRYRCEYCRLNFASFRRRKEIFSFSRWKKIEARNSAALTPAPDIPGPEPSDN